MKSRSTCMGLALGLLVTTLMAACAPTTATVSGKIRKNGSAVSFQEVSLVHMLDDGDEESTLATADNAGAFRFEDVAPGKYYLLTTFSAITPQDSGTSPSVGGLAPWQQALPQPFSLADPLGRKQTPGACTAEGPEMSAVIVLGTNDAGDNVTISVISNSEEPLELEAGDSIEKEVIVYCR